MTVNTFCLDELTTTLLPQFTALQNLTFIVQTWYFAQCLVIDFTY